MGANGPLAILAIVFFAGVIVGISVATIVAYCWFAPRRLEVQIIERTVGCQSMCTYINSRFVHQTQGFSREGEVAIDDVKIKRRKAE